MSQNVTLRMLADALRGVLAECGDLHRTETDYRAAEGQPPLPEAERVTGARQLLALYDQRCAAIDAMPPERVSACVAACTGIETGQLVGFSLLDFRESAMDVARNWERGDLAGAVNALQGSAESLGGKLSSEDEDEADVGADAAAA